MHNLKIYSKNILFIIRKHFTRDDNSYDIIAVKVNLLVNIIHEKNYSLINLKPFT